MKMLRATVNLPETKVALKAERKAASWAVGKGLKTAAPKVG